MDKNKKCESILPIGTEMYYRNVSTGSPTLVHLVKENGSTFCGFKSFGAEHILVDESDYIMPGQVCKKCLRISNPQTPTNGK